MGEGVKTIRFYLVAKDTETGREAVGDLADTKWDPGMVAKLGELYGPEEAARSVAEALTGSVARKVEASRVVGLLVRVGILGEPPAEEEPESVDKPAPQENPVEREELPKPPRPIALRRVRVKGDAGTTVKAKSLARVPEAVEDLEEAVDCTLPAGKYGEVRQVLFGGLAVVCLDEPVETCGLFLLEARSLEYVEDGESEAKQPSDESETLEPSELHLDT